MSKYILVALIAIVAMYGIANAGAVTSVVDYSAMGHIDSGMSSISNGCNFTNMISTGTSGLANMRYNSVVSNGTVYTDSVNYGGRLNVRSNMMSMNWEYPETVCIGDECGDIGGSYSQVSASYQASLSGMGDAQSYTAPNTMNLNARGNGVISVTSKAIDMKGNVNNCVDTNEYSERTRISGVYDLMSRFTFTR
jgi:hypothetical protein